MYILRVITTLHVYTMSCVSIHVHTGKVDMVIIGTGSGGTVCGVGRKIKEVYPNCKVGNVTAHWLASQLTKIYQISKNW